MERKFGALSSSEDGNKLATSVTGVIKLVSGLLLAMGIATQADVNTLVGQIEIIIPSAYALYGAAEAVFGVLRKIVINVHARFQE